MQPVEHLPDAAPDAVELAGAAAAPSGGRCDGTSGVFATLGLQLERVRAAQPHGVRVEVWFQDEARIGQKNSLTRVWGQTGSRPAAPKDLGFASAYVFGAVCPLEGKAAALIMPICNTVAMNHHLCEISSQVAAPRFREGRLCPCRGDPRWCRLAPQPRTRGAQQYHAVGAAAVQPGAQSGRADLALSAQSLARQLGIFQPSGHHGGLRDGLEQVCQQPRPGPLALRGRLGFASARFVGLPVIEPWSAIESTLSSGNFRRSVLDGRKADASSAPRLSLAVPTRSNIIVKASDAARAFGAALLDLLGSFSIRGGTPWRRTAPANLLQNPSTTLFVLSLSKQEDH